MGVRKSDHYQTPDEVYGLIKDIWGFDKEDMYDPCPFRTDNENALESSWRYINYVNPPYSKLVEFVKHAIFQAHVGRISIMLLPCKTDQIWFHDLILKNKFQAKFVPFRIRFIGERWNARETHFLVRIDFKTAGRHE